MGCPPICGQRGDSASSEMSDISSIRGHLLAVVLTYITSIIHCLLAIMCIVLGVLSSWSSEIWTAHRVSPIWSGGFFLLTAGIGIVTAKKRTGYLVMCYGALCIVSIVVGIVCIQLLKRGLFTHLSDGAMYRQEELDINVILGMATCGMEILVCILSIPVCCQMAAKVKEEVHMKRDGTFSIQILGDKDIIIQQSDSTSYDRLYEDDTVSELARVSTRDCSNLLLATTALARATSRSSPGRDMKQRSKLDFATVVQMTRKTNIPNKDNSAADYEGLDVIAGVV
ncbi:uncharacterized protein [Watersipora subatra]|uniref:uncharacterized protein n=1 Tax=Watersipora subatra TaxID=2589382 RepID=UPI00355B52E6